MALRGGEFAHDLAEKLSQRLLDSELPPGASLQVQPEVFLLKNKAIRRGINSLSNYLRIGSEAIGGKSIIVNDASPSKGA